MINYKKIQNSIIKDINLSAYALAEGLSASASLKEDGDIIEFIAYKTIIKKDKLIELKLTNMPIETPFVFILVKIDFINKKIHMEFCITEKISGAYYNKIKKNIKDFLQSRARTPKYYRTNFNMLLSYILDIPIFMFRKGVIKKIKIKDLDLDTADSYKNKIKYYADIINGEIDNFIKSKNG